MRNRDNRRRDDSSSGEGISLHDDGFTSSSSSDRRPRLRSRSHTPPPSPPPRSSGTAPFRSTVSFGCERGDPAKVESNAKGALSSSPSPQQMGSGVCGRHRPHHRFSAVDVHPTMERLRHGGAIAAADPMAVRGDDTRDDDNDGGGGDGKGRQKHESKEEHDRRRSQKRRSGDDAGRGERCREALRQVPAVALLSLFHLMVGIPFGVSYFPVGWRAADRSAATMTTAEEGVWDESDGAFPLPGKESLGIRMFLFSTAVGQVVFAYASRFDNAIGLQMVENVPFCHALADVVTSHQGYGIDALSTLFFLFGLASVVVGATFYLLGRFELGRVVYFFPSHVLVGLIGGIGVFIAKTGLEVTTDEAFAFSGAIGFVSDHLDHLGVVAAFEMTLRLLLFATGGRSPLLSPVYFCAITPVFYLGVWALRVDTASAREAGYFFPALDDTPCVDPTDASNGCVSSSSGVASSVLSLLDDEHMFDLWRVLDPSVVSWTAVYHSIPTLIALTLFSLIHVPINIPAFAISTDREADMNAELVAHGYSNALVGMVGGLQNYMAYTQSVLFARSGGAGRASSLAVAAMTAVLFVVGPYIASYIPRCMAGTLLLHVGIDLFLEGVLDSYGKYDILEYGGIWFIVVVMTCLGMEAALIAGAISALSTYAVQSITYLNPIRGSMSATTLRSSSWERSPEANDILNDDSIGRKRIFVVQFQGHLFFGNCAQLLDNIKTLLTERQGTNEDPWILIMDFSLVLGMDSSAAQAIMKLKRFLHKNFHVVHCVFVTGSCEGFPCEMDLSRELSIPETPVNKDAPAESVSDLEGVDEGVDERTKLLRPPQLNGSVENILKNPENKVCDSLDSALIFAEDALVALQDPDLLGNGSSIKDRPSRDTCSEGDLALRYLANLCPDHDVERARELLSLFEREVYAKDEILWKQGETSSCAKLLVKGCLVSVLENEAGTREGIRAGSMIGELGLVHGANRMSTVQCESEEAILYNLSKDSWEQLTSSNPKTAQLLFHIVIRYLTHRVQHVSNRIFETQCVPI